MSLGAVGTFLLVLIVVFVIGNLWFHFVESLLERIKHLLTSRRDPPAWHPLPPDEGDSGDGPPGTV